MSTPQILVVEDDNLIRESLVELLDSEGFRVEEAEHGKAALRLLESGATPSVILLDLMMPEMNGWELLQVLRNDARFKTIPVIVVSAAGDHQNYPRLATAYLKKPVDVDALLNEITRQLPTVA